MKTTKPKPVLKRVRFTYEALCEVDVNIEEMDLATVLLECKAGDLSGRYIGAPRVAFLNHTQALAACEQHGTDKEFFRLPAFKVGTRVWWRDPDRDACSGWYRIVGWNGEFYEMTNRAGGECEAPEHELSLRAQRPT